MPGNFLSALGPNNTNIASSPDSVVVSAEFKPDVTTIGERFNEPDNHIEAGPGQPEYGGVALEMDAISLNVVTLRSRALTSDNHLRRAA